jgi:transcriptional regulator with XRE-family HTH domain
MTVTLAQLRAGRALLNWTTERLASASCVHRETIGKIESGRVYAPQKATLARLVAALERGGVVFTESGMVGIKADILRFSASVSRISDR